MSWSGTVTCSYCYKQGHNKRKCPELTEAIERQYHGHLNNAKEMRGQGNDHDAKWYESRAEEKRQQYIKRTKIDLASGEKVTNKAAKAARMKKVKCGYCGERGHTRRVCQVVKRDQQLFVEQTRRERIAALETARESGIGVGTMIPIRASGYNSDGAWTKTTQLRYVKSVDWDGCVANREKLRVHHVDARKLGAANQSRWTSNDSIEQLTAAYQEARTIAINGDEKPPMVSLVPTLDPPAGWLEPTEKSLKNALKREFPTTGNEYNKQRKYYYQWPEAHLQEIIKALGLTEYYKQS